MKVSMDEVILQVFDKPKVYMAHQVKHDDDFFRRHKLVHQNKHLDILHRNHLDFCNHKYCIRWVHTEHTLHLVHIWGQLVQLGNNVDYQQKMIKNL